MCGQAGLKDYDRAGVLLGPKEQLQKATTLHACLIIYKARPTRQHATYRHAPAAVHNSPPH